MMITSSGSQQDDLLKGLLPRSAQSRLHGSGDFPVIDEYERSRLLRIGGRYCGYVQEQVNRVFDDLWVENTICYFHQRQVMVRVCVLTKAYSGTISKPLLNPSDTACYVTSATIRDGRGQIIQSAEIIHTYPGQRRSVLEMSVLAEIFHVTFSTHTSQTGVFDIDAANEQIAGFGIRGEVIG